MSISSVSSPIDTTIFEDMPDFSLEKQGRAFSSQPIDVSAFERMTAFELERQTINFEREGIVEASHPLYRQIACKIKVTDAYELECQARIFEQEGNTALSQLCYQIACRRFILFTKDEVYDEVYSSSPGSSNFIKSSDCIDETSTPLFSEKVFFTPIFLERAFICCAKVKNLSWRAQAAASILSTFNKFDDVYERSPLLVKAFIYEAKANLKEMLEIPNFIEVLKDYQQAAKLYKKLHRFEEAAINYRKAAILYEKFYQFENATINYRKAAILYEKFYQFENATINYRKAAVSYCLIKRYSEKAQKCIKKVSFLTLKYLCEFSLEFRIKFLENNGNYLLEKSNIVSNIDQKNQLLKRAAEEFEIVAKISHQIGKLTNACRLYMRASWEYEKAGYFFKAAIATKNASMLETNLTFKSALLKRVDLLSKKDEEALEEELPELRD